MYILFDIGGTKMRVAASKDCKELIGDPIVEKTPKDFDEGVGLLVDIAKKLSNGQEIKAIGGGIAGPLDKDKTKLLNSINLSGWINRPFKERIEKELNTTLYLANDTAIVGLGEACVGAGKGYNIVTYITVSTGVGGVRIVNKNIDHRAYGFEPGHQIIDIDNTVCPECKSGQLEDIVSGTAIEYRFGVKPYEVKDQKLWDEVLPKLLSYGLYNTILHWSPDVVVLGGSMIIGDPAINVEQTKEYLRGILNIFPTLPVIKKAELGDFGGIHGALTYVYKNISKNN